MTSGIPSSSSHKGQESVKDNPGSVSLGLTSPHPNFSLSLEQVIANHYVACTLCQPPF